MSRLPDRQLLAPLIERAGGTAEVSLLLTSLYSEGFLDRRALEALYARSEVNRLVKEGQGRCRAMDEVADRLCCSYEKVRAMVYNNSKFKMQNSKL